MSTRAPSISDPWEANASFWIQIIREGRDRYRTELTDPAVMDAIGSAGDRTILDAGCGEGYLSRALAKAGATVTGIDLSAPLIVAAKAAVPADGMPVRFDVGSLYDLPYKDNGFDVVVCNHAINDLREPGTAIREFARVLRPAGRLVILMLHPCFYNSHLERDLAEPARTVAMSYFSERRIEQTFKVDGLTSPAANTAWFRPLEYYIEQLSQSSFVITGLTEPHPQAKQISDDAWWREKFIRPLFMLITAELR